INTVLGENSFTLPQNSGVAYKYIYSTTTTSLSGSPTSWQVRERHGPLSEREGARAHSQTAAYEREAKLNTSHKVYIDRSYPIESLKLYSIACIHCLKLLWIIY